MNPDHEYMMVYINFGGCTLIVMSVLYSIVFVLI